MPELHKICTGRWFEAVQLIPNGLLNIAICSNFFVQVLLAWFGSNVGIYEE
jgi:hypothetical protein